MWYKAPAMQSAGDMSPADSIVGALNNKLQTQSSTPEDGRKYRPKLVELIEIINKLSLLHLVGCLYYCIHIFLKRHLLILLRKCYRLCYFTLHFGPARQHPEHTVCMYGHRTDCFMSIVGTK